MMNSNLCQHSIVFNFRFPQRRTVVSDDNQLPYKKNNQIKNTFTYLIIPLTNQPKTVHIQKSNPTKKHEEKNHLLNSLGT